MSSVAPCRCCLLRPPDKDLKTSYSNHGKTEIYADMLKECFEIHLLMGDGSGRGICEVCVSRLRDACEFKQQVQRCQDTQLRLVKDESVPQVKQEAEDPDDDHDIFFLDVKDEMSDVDMGKEDEDNKKLAELLSLNDVRVRKVLKKKSAKKKSVKQETNSKGVKEELSLEDMRDEDDKKLAELLGISGLTVKKTLRKKNGKKRSLILDAGADRKSKLPFKLNLRSIEKLNPILLISENKKHRVNIENVLKYSNCTPFSNKTLAGLVCAYCKETCPDAHTLRAHTQERHRNDELNDNKRMDKNNISIKMDITDLKCNVCNANFDVISNLKKHLSKEHDVKFYPDVNDYILEFKLTGEEIMNCALCNSTFETFKMLLQHMNGHYRNYICEVCDMGFINKHRLKNHQRTHEVGNFKCSFCEKVFTTRIRKMCHEKYTHNSNARYTTNCPHCNQSFTSYYQRNRHMVQEHNAVAASYKCNICEKSFILKSKLTSHIKKVHLMERNHICAECGQGFFIKQSLDEHMIKHNGERVFKCTVCHKAYARKKTLREHMRIHNNDRRFKCGVCGSAFVQKCSLKSHMLSNHGITLSEYETAKTSISNL